MSEIKNSIKAILILSTALILVVFIDTNDKSVIYKNRGLVKKNMLHKDAIESSIFVFKNKLYYLISEKADPSKKKPEEIAIYSFPGRQKINSLDTPGMRLASVLVDKGKLYIFLTKDWVNYGNSTIYLTSSIDLKKFNSLVPIVKANTGEGLFNTSVTKNTKTREYIMALEFDAKGYTTFSIRFLKSNDLLKWTEFEDQVFGSDIYAACPKIKYIDGSYYIWYAVVDEDSTNKKLYKVKMAKSTDLKTWIISKKFFLSPSPDEGINNSDVDLVEYKNKTYILYADGNQATWGNIRYATYNGSVSEAIDEYF